MRGSSARRIGVAIAMVMAFVGGERGQAQTPPPAVTLSNGPLTVLVYLPDPTNGFFRGTRFDWSGIIGRLDYAGHVFYEKWFAKTDPAMRDWDVDPDVVAGPNTAITGPAEEFQRPLGFEEAPAGGAFVKIGVGVLRKPSDGAAYSAFRLYEIAEPGHRTVETRADSATFTHEVTEPASGYGYAYTKALRLTPGQPVLTLEHALRNTGTRRIETVVYNHNFLTLDGLTSGPGFVVRAPYDIQSARPPASTLAEIRGRDVVYLSDLTGRQVVSTPLTGFGPTAADYDFRVEHTRARAGVRMTGDRPLSNAALWSMRATIAVEPFIAIAIDPGQTFTWTLTYTYYLLDR